MPIYEPNARTRYSPRHGERARPLPPESVKRIFERIIDEMRVVQKKKNGRRVPMLVVMQEGATEAQIQSVIDKLVRLGFDVHRSTAFFTRARRRGRARISSPPISR